MSQHHNTESQKQLLDACASGNKEELLQLVLEGCDPVEIYNECGQTPLHIASYHGQFDIVRLLVEAYGCDHRRKDNRGCMPIHEACLGGHLKTAGYLLQWCVDYSAYIKDNSGDIILHKACRSGNLALVRLIVYHIMTNTAAFNKINLYHDDVFQYDDKCVNVCGQDPSLVPSFLPRKLVCLNLHGDTPLHTACRCGHLNIVKYFMDELHGRVAIMFIASLLQVACQSGQTEVVQYLLETKGGNPMEKDLGIADSGRSHYQESHAKISFGNSLVHTACLCGNISLVKTLLTQYKHCLTVQNVIGNIPLHCACISDNVSLVNLLMTDYKCDCETPNLNGDTPLHTACEWGSLRVANILINDFHCNPNTCNKDGETPLHFACKYGRLDICNLLFADNCNSCDITIQTSTKETPLHMACCGTSPELVKSLLEHCSSNQDIPDDYGDTPLFNACRSGEVEMVKLLTGKYCNPLYVNELTQETPAHIACRMQRLDILHVLLSKNKKELNQRNVFGETPLHIACKKDSIEIVNFLMHNDYTDPTIRDQSGSTALHIACNRKQTQIAQCLISSLSTCDQVDNCGNTPLIVACSRRALDIVKLLTTATLCGVNIQNNVGNTALHTACLGCDTDVVKLLTELESCNVNSKNCDGNTPLHLACLVSSLDIVKLLVRCCDICIQNGDGNLDHLKNNNGVMLLHIACSNGALDIVQFLAQNQFCDVNETDQEGNTALHSACKAGNTEIAVYLMSTQECNLMKRNTSGHPPLFYAVECKQIALVKHLVKEKHFNLTDPDQTYYFKPEDRYLPLLHFVYLCQMTDLAMFLVSGHYCDPNQQDSKGNTLLHIIAERYWGTVVEDLLSYLLSSEDCNLNCTNHKGATPLHVACRKHEHLFVEALLNTKRKIEVSPTDLDGKTPIQLAERYELIRLLIDHGANPQDVYQHYGRELERSKSIHPLHPFMKLFVLGNSEAGKSTLVECLKTETVDPKLIVTVEGPTAGVVQSEFESKEFGKVLIYDFAGHPEFHSSHSACLESSLSPSTFSSPPIFIVVVSLNGSGEQIIKSLQYWTQYIENHCSSTYEVKAHTIVIGSHADLLSPTALSDLLSSLKKQTLEILKPLVLQYFGPLCLDCRNPVSEELKSLRTLLKETCSSLRQHIELDCRCHVLFTYLHEHFSNVSAITVGELQGRIRGSRPRFPTRVTLPFVAEELMKLLCTLHDKGHLLMLQQASEIKEHWIVLNPHSLLRCVNGVIFAPQTFVQHLTVETNTGVVPSYKLKGLFPDLDLNMVEQFLVYSELCKIIDNDTLKLIQGNEDSYVDSEQPSGTPMEYENKFYFFPGLISAERPVNVWSQQDSQDWGYCCGWCIQCKPQQFLTTRFLQVLLLRLVFNYAAVIDEDSGTVEALALKRRCDVWKNGVPDLESKFLLK